MTTELIWANRSSATHELSIVATELHVSELRRRCVVFEARCSCGGWWAKDVAVGDGDIDASPGLQREHREHVVHEARRRAGVTVP